MSGIAGIVNWDGATVDLALLSRFEQFLRERGPDGKGMWLDGNVGLVHTLFCTVEEAQGERQPCSLDGEVWIVADARIDGRADLVRNLVARGRDASLARPDVELILHAYAVWGESCLDHLVGDFTFAIWDKRTRKLFCGRDQFGIKPFFYASVAGSLIFSNTLDAIRLHPNVSDTLDDLMIADFLLFGEFRERDRSAYADIRRLAPAHALVADRSGVRQLRYWTLPVDDPPRFRRPQEYVERFLQLLEQAVADRLRTNRIAVTMSGGLDSTSVAAMAKRALARTGRPFHLCAFAIVYDHLVPYQERRFAGSAAKALGLAIEFFPVDDYELYASWEADGIRLAEPACHPHALMSRDFLRLVAANAPVALTGQGGDPAFSSCVSRHLRSLVMRGRLDRAAVDLVRYLASDGRRSRLYLHARLQIWRNGRYPLPPYPRWLNPELERRFDLPNRYTRTNWSSSPGAVPRPEAYEILTYPTWPFQTFEDWEPILAGVPLEIRHPYFDISLLRYLLSLPALPWCSDKELVRRAMLGLLPDEVRLRKKTPMLPYPVSARKLLVTRTLHGSSAPEPELARFVQGYRADDALRETGLHGFVRELRPFLLNSWLKSRVSPANVLNVPPKQTCNGSVQ